MKWAEAFRIAQIRRRLAGAEINHFGARVLFFARRGEPVGGDLVRVLGGKFMPGGVGRGQGPDFAGSRFEQPVGRAGLADQTRLARQGAFAAAPPCLRGTKPVRLLRKKAGMGELGGAIGRGRIGQHDRQSRSEPQGHERRKSDADPAMEEHEHGHGANPVLGAA